VKITKEHYEQMALAMFGIHTEAKKTEYAQAGLSGKRYRWDMARNAGLMPFICDTLYKYCDDSHIDTALRQITDTK